MMKVLPSKLYKGDVKSQEGGPRCHLLFRLHFSYQTIPLQMVFLFICCTQSNCICSLILAFAGPGGIPPRHSGYGHLDIWKHPWIRRNSSLQKEEGWWERMLRSEPSVQTSGNHVQTCKSISWKNEVGVRDFTMIDFAPNDARRITRLSFSLILLIIM